jgi:A/G-specific adenine glycosylase
MCLDLAASSYIIKPKFKGLKSPVCRTFKLIAPEVFQSVLLAWYERFGRKDLPWQKPRTPYRVWVSEIMLQQTQVSTVIPYFQKFMAAFPTVQALAEATLDEVLRCWAGLGYYARARNLHRAAVRIIAEHQGEVPKDLPALLNLPGIGRSTAGAIMSLAFDQPAPILDGNVKRLWSRLHGIEGDLNSPAVERQLWALSEYYLPQRRNADYTQALMDFGAGVCTRAKPHCARCVLQDHCLAYRRGRVFLPASRTPRIKPTKFSYWLLLQDKENRVYLHQLPPVGVWGGLWAPLQYETRESLEEGCRSLSIRSESLKQLSPRRWEFTHYLLCYTPVLAKVSEPLSILHDRPACWLKLQESSQLAMPTPVKRLLAELESKFVPCQ